MPFYDIEDRPVTTPIGVQPLEDLTAAPVVKPAEPSKDYGIDYGNSPNQIRPPSLLGATFRQDNIIGSAMSRKDAGITHEIEDGFNPFDKNKGTKYEARPELFTDIFNAKALEARRNQIDMEDEDRAVIDRSGLKGMAASFMWQFFDPTILAPGGGLVKANRMGYSIGKSALSIGAAAAGGAALQEGILQSTQQTRPWEDSAMAIGSSLVLGGLLGGTAAGLLSRAESRLADRGYRVLSQALTGETAAAGGTVSAPLAELSSRVRAGEPVTASEIVEAARVAALQARQADAGVERLARIDNVIEPILRNLEREASRAQTSDLTVAAKSAFGSDAARLMDAGGLRIVQSVEDLPARPDGTAHPGDVRGMFDGNTAYLVADNVAPDEVKGVLLHEVGVHYGMERMLGQQYGALLQDVMARAQANEARFAEALAAVPKDTPAQHVAEEALAYLVERAPEVGIVQRVITAVKQFIREAFGGKITGLSEDDIRAMAVSALRKWKPDAVPANVRNPRYSITPEQARRLRGEVRIPTSKEFKEAVAGTPAARLVADGVEIDVVRFQKPQQDGMASVRTGVFYLPKGSPQERHYKSGATGYGGASKQEGTTLLRAPLFVKGATGGKAPEAAFDLLKGKGAYEAMRRDVLNAAMKRGSAQEEAVYEVLAKYGADPNMAYDIVANSKVGNQLAYAVQENIVAHAVREAGHDSVLGYSKGKAGPFLSEVFDVREATYPERGIDSEVHPDFHTRSDIDALKYSRGQTKTPEFKRWFGNSKVLDEDGKPKVMYHVTDGDFSAFKVGGRGAIFFSTSPDAAARAAQASKNEMIGGGTSAVMPVFLKVEHLYGQTYVRPKGVLNVVGTTGSDAKVQSAWESVKASIEKTTFSQNQNVNVHARELAWKDFVNHHDIVEVEPGTWRIVETKMDASARLMGWEEFEKGPRYGDTGGIGREAIKALGYDGAKISDEGSTAGAETIAVFSPNQIKSAIGNSGAFDPANPDIRFSRGGSRNDRIAEQLDTLVRALDAVDDPAAFANIFAGRAAAAGAEFADQKTLEDLTVAGTGARAYAAATKFLNPNLRANFRASVAARQATQQLLENTVFQQMHANNGTLGPAVETMMRQEYRSRVIAAARAADEIYAAGRKAGMQMVRRDFDEAVAKAMRREDVGENEFVSKAAESYRKEMFDHFKVMAQKTLGKDGKPLLPEDLQVVGAPSYLTRMPNHERLTADEMGFKETVARYYEGVFRGEYQKHAEQTRNRLAALDREIADLKMSPEDRAKAMEGIDQRLTEMETTNSREIDLLAEINRYRTQATKAAERGDRKAAKAAKEEASRLFEQGGDELRAFLKERTALRTRQRRIDLNYAGMQEREDRIASQIADIEDRNVRTMQRLISRGQKAERDFARLDPAKRAEKIAELRTQFSDIAARSEKAADQLAERARAIAAEELAGLQRAMKERGAGGIKSALAGTTEVKAKAKGEESRKALAEAIKKNAVAERARADRLNSIARRLEEAEAFDIDGQVLELKRALSDLAEQASGTSLDRGARIQRLVERARNLDPAKLDERLKTIERMRSDIEQEFYGRWEGTRGGEGVDLENAASKVNFRGYAEDVARQIYDHYTGRSAESGTVPDFAVPLASGPLKERTFNIPDKLIEPWLENDITRIADRYARTMAAQIELTRKFGRADLRDQIFAIHTEYRDLRERVGLAKTADEALEIVGQKPGALDSFQAWRRGEDINKVTKERILSWLDKDEQGAKSDLEAGRDLILGRYKLEENRSDYAKIASGLLAFNYVRAMGGAVIANLGDIYRSAMVNGLGRFMKDGVAPLLTNLEGFKASVKEAQLAGQVGEKWLHQRMATFAEIGDPYAKGTALERTLENMSRFASKWNGLSVFTDFSKSIASVTTQNRIIEAIAGGKEQRFLRWAGLDPFMEGRIKEQIATHGRIIDGIRVAETEKWTDPEAVRAYRAAVGKTVDTIAVERSVGDIPLFVNTPTGRLIAQFRTFNLAANQRVLLNGMQDNQARFVGSLVAMASIGMMVSTLRSWRGGEDRWKKFKESAANPGFLIGEGLDNSGIFTVPFEIANTIEKLTQPSGFSFNPIKTPLMKVFPGKSQQGESTRFASRDPIGALLGPSAGLPMTLAKALGGDIKAGSQLLPFSTYPGMREAVQALTGDSPYGF